MPFRLSSLAGFLYRVLGASSWALSVAPFGDAAGRALRAFGARANSPAREAHDGQAGGDQHGDGHRQSGVDRAGHGALCRALAFQRTRSAAADVHLRAVIFYLVARDYFQVVRLKGFYEFWKIDAAGRRTGCRQNRGDLILILWFIYCYLR